MKVSMRGLTILELLIAIAILAIALLTLAAVLTSGTVGIRDDGRRTVANQVAVTVLEDLRRTVRSDSTRSFDDADDSDTFERVLSVGGQSYAATYTVEPRRVDGEGALVAVGTEAPLIYDVGVDVLAPNGAVHSYRTLLVRPMKVEP